MQVQPYQSSLIDLDEPGNEYSVSLTSSLGMNLQQVVADLNRYPYGCVEQVSSKTRGLIALSQVSGITEETTKKIQIGIDNLIAKQKLSGAFGYWDRNSAVYERFQPYAVDTLQKTLPFASDKEKVRPQLKTVWNISTEQAFGTPRPNYTVMVCSQKQVTRLLRERGIQ